MPYVGELCGIWIRLDAVLYVAKRKGTRCFFAEPEIWESFQQCSDILKDSNSVGVSFFPTF